MTSEELTDEELQLFLELIKQKEEEFEEEQKMSPDFMDRYYE